MTPEVEISDHPEQARYEARLDGQLVGLAAYRLGEHVITFTHTEVDPDRQGQGSAGRWRVSHWTTPDGAGCR